MFRHLQRPPLKGTGLPELCPGSVINILDFLAGGKNNQRGFVEVVVMDGDNVLVQINRIKRGMDVALVLWHLGSKGRDSKAAAYAEDQICAV